MAANPASFTIAREVAAPLTNDAHQSADLESLVKHHARLVFKVAYGILRNSHDAEDVVQETFLRAHRDGLQSIRNPQGWLATVACRLAIDRKRKLAPLDLGDFDVPSSQPDAEHTAIHRQQINSVHRLIAALPEDLRYPLVLSALGELNSRQIAHMLGINESAVRGRIMRARQFLKEKLSARMEPKR